MKKGILFSVMALFCLTAAAQDSTKVDKADTIRFGSIVIIKHPKKGGRDGKEDKDVDIQMGRKTESRKNKNVSTNWWIVDLGISNYTDKTNYSSTGGYLVNKPGSPALGASDFKLKTGKSINVNIWIFMQRLRLVENAVSLKYGIGMELNNYAYKTSSSLSYKEGGPVPYTNTQTNAPFVFRDSIAFSKNKLAADYLTVPLMLSLKLGGGSSSSKGLTVSGGVSAGYLYSQRNKQKSDARGKDRNKGDYDLERFKFSYVGEVGLGSLHLYGSYSPKSMYSRGLDMRPYNVGIRFSNW